MSSGRFYEGLLFAVIPAIHVAEKRFLWRIIVFELGCSDDNISPSRHDKVKQEPSNFLFCISLPVV